jgi:hemerythrin-like domain-containing protein
MLAEIRARMDTNLNKMREEIKSGQAEMRSTICAFWSELKQTIQHEMEAIIQPIQSELDEKTACNEMTETEPNPGMTQSTEEHQEILKGEVARMPV